MHDNFVKYAFERESELRKSRNILKEPQSYLQRNINIEKSSWLDRQWAGWLKVFSSLTICSFEPGSWGLLPAVPPLLSPLLSSFFSPFPLCIPLYLRSFGLVCQRASLFAVDGNGYIRNAQANLRDLQLDSPLPTTSLTRDRTAFTKDTSYRYRSLIQRAMLSLVVLCLDSVRFLTPVTLPWCFSKICHDVSTGRMKSIRWKISDLLK